jgi:amino acid transporter
VHPTGHFPHVSLLVLGLLAVAASFLSLGVVIDVLIAARILIQFVGQIVALWLLRKHAPNLERPYRVWLYPLPLLLAGAGWLLVFATTPLKVIGFALAAMAVGVGGYFAWSKQSAR